MKKILSTILVCVLLIGTMFVLASCGGKIDKGEYVSTGGNIVEIEGKNFVITIDDEEHEYTYEIKTDEDDSDKQKIYLYDSDGDLVLEEYFEKLDDGFKFGGDQYTKK